MSSFFGGGVLDVHSVTHFDGIIKESLVSVNFDGGRSDDVLLGDDTFGEFINFVF